MINLLLLNDERLCFINGCTATEMNIMKIIELYLCVSTFLF